MEKDTSHSPQGDQSFRTEGRHVAQGVRPSPQGDHSVCREGRHIDCGLFVMSSPTPTLLLPDEEKI